jgi:hypothetical protein
MAVMGASLKNVRIGRLVLLLPTARLGGGKGRYARDVAVRIV